MRITIVGAAKSGLAAAELALRNGDVPFVTDSRDASTMAEAKARLEHLGIRHEFGVHSELAYDADLVVLSPGIPPMSDIRRNIVNRRIECIGEMEYAWRQIPNRTIAITGTNGKTTTTALTTFMLKNSGIDAVAVGNIGTPLSSLVGSINEEVVVVAETSSYQLDTTINFRPYVSVVLNVTPDHAGYHGSFEQYSKAKWKIFENQRDADIVILNADDPQAAAAASVAQARVRYISVRTEQLGAFVRGDDVFLAWDSLHKEELLMPLRRLGLRGVHNVYNSMAAALAARALEVRNEDIRDSLQSFAGVEHRLENVRTLGNVMYINDSKATNINAAWYALSSFDRPIVWIAGGRGDNNDYESLDELVATNVHAIVCIGEESNTIFNHWCTRKRCIKADSLADAVRHAAELADDGDVVLLSPACKSFDMFSSFEDRGLQYKELVNAL